MTYTFKGYTRPWYHAIRVDVYDGEIRPGERITLTFGDTRYGSIGQRAPTAVNKRCEWKVLVDPFCTRCFVPLQDRPSLEIISDDPVRLAAILPSDAVCGERMRVLIRAEDKWGNPASGYRGGAYLVWEPFHGAPEGLPRVIEFTEKDKGVKIFEDVGPKREGIFRLRLYDERLGLDCPSNPCVCHIERPSLLRFWGDLHGQSEEALGRRCADHPACRRAIANLDFHDPSLERLIEIYSCWGLFTWTDLEPPASSLAYFVRVIQENGGRAYSSPFYVILASK